jgi:serine/threonine-protein kinase
MVAPNYVDDTDPRLDQLVQRWEELRQRGESRTPEELCSTCPQLAAPLARRIALLRAFDPFLTPPTLAAAVPIAPGSAREAAAARAEYHELSFHAAGGLGEVYRARDAALNREVALKFLKPARGADPDARRRFLQEAEITGRLEHPGVVPIYALGSDNVGVPCYAMRLIRGETLQHAIAACHRAGSPGHDPGGRRLALRALLDRFMAVCNTVAYAHSRRILHRDLKPGNILLGPYGETLVVDWGLAKPFERDETSEGGEEALTPSSGSGTPTVGVVGTLAYMSPEQARERSARVGPASDLFSLGAILYAILTGEAPYRGAAYGEVLEKVRGCDFPAPRRVRPDTPRALEAICLRAMASESADRYATALELAADVKRWLTDEPVTAWPEPLALRVRRWMRRHRTMVTSATAVLVFGLVGLTGFATVLAGKNRELDAKNVDLAAKIQELDRQRRRAEAREELALDAVKKFRDAVQGNPELKSRPELDGLRKGLLKEPMAFFRDLRDQLQADLDTRPEALARLAAASFDLAKTTEEIGHIPDALRSHSEALALRERLAREFPTVPRYRSDLGASHQAIAYLSSLTGHTSEALDSYRRAIALRESLTHDHLDVLSYQDDLAASHQGIGVLLGNMGHPAEALDEFRRMVAIMEPLARDHPTSTRYQDGLATGHDGLGWLQRATGRLDEALQSHRRALEVRRLITQVDPTNLRYESARAWTYLAVADLLHITGHPAEALDTYRQALAIRERLAGDHPTVTNYQGDRALCYNNYGILLNITGHRSEALDALRQALAIREKLAREHPAVGQYQHDEAYTQYVIGTILREANPTDVPDADKRALEIRERLVRDYPEIHAYRSVLGASLEAIAETEMARGRWREARALLERAIAAQRAALAAMPGCIDYQVPLRSHLLNLARVYKALGRPSETIRVIRELMELPRGNADDLFTVACALALNVPLSRGEAQHAMTDEAVKTLREAIAAGWADARKLGRAPDLAPLRDHADFRRLLAGLFDRDFPVDPFAR